MSDGSAAVPQAHVYELRLSTLCLSPAGRDQKKVSGRWILPTSGYFQSFSGFIQEMGGWASQFHPAISSLTACRSRRHLAKNSYNAADPSSLAGVRKGEDSAEPGIRAKHVER